MLTDVHPIRTRPLEQARRVSPWRRRMATGALALLCAGLASAQSPASTVTESTDPARAAAVERAAQALRARQQAQQRAGEAPSAATVVRGTTADGLAFVSGGVTVDDRVTMHAERAAYSLWVATVARGSGAYLADARLRIVNVATKATVVERTMDGPWFLLALPAGSYEVSATVQADGVERAQTLSSRITVPARGQRQVVLRFLSAANVAPEMQSPFDGNPFGQPPARP